MHKLLRKPSPAMIIACLALFMASAGTSIAARSYLITSTKQIKPSVLAKLKGAKGPRGSQGPQGAQGLQGAAGPSGIASIIEVQGADLSLAPGSYGSATAACPSGYVVVGTGWNGVFGDIGGFVKSYHTFVGGWFDNQYASITLTLNVQAICAQLSSVSASSLSSKGQGAADYAADVAAAQQAAEQRH